MIHYRIPLEYQFKKKKGSKSLKISTNKIYAGIHWGQRKSIKDRITDTAGKFCGSSERIQSYPVEIDYRFLFGTRPLDTLNCAYMAKMFEDALRSLGILEEDDPKYVARSSIEVIAVPRKKRSKKDSTSWEKVNAQSKDWLEITIKPYASTYQPIAEGHPGEHAQAVVPSR